MARQLKARPDGPDPFWDRYFPLQPPTTNTLVQDLHRSLDQILSTNPCQFGISRHCTREDGYDWKGRHCCAHCFSVMERVEDFQL